MSPDGYITITGRIKDLIIRGGENIHPLEIENCLLTHPGVTDVSVVGVPDERYGEVVAAFIICKEQDRKIVTEDKIREWVRERLSNHLGKHLLPFSLSRKTFYRYLNMLTSILLIVPKYVFFLSRSESFPKTASGKVQKFKLKETAIRILNEQSNAN